MGEEHAKGSISVAIEDCLLVSSSPGVSESPNACTHLETIEQLQQELYTERQKRRMLEELLPNATLQEVTYDAPLSASSKVHRSPQWAKRFFAKHTITGVIHYATS